MTLRGRRRNLAAPAAAAVVAGVAGYTALFGLPKPFGSGRDAALADDTFRSYCVD